MNNQPKYDIRRLVRVNAPVSGKEISAAMREIATAMKVKYEEHDAQCSFRGTKLFRVGISSDYPYQHVVIAADPRLSSEHLDVKSDYRGYSNENESLTKFGVKSTCWPVETHAVGFSEDGVIKAVEAVRESLERILNRGGK